MKVKFTIPQGAETPTTNFIKEERSHHFHLIATSKTKGGIKRKYETRFFSGRRLFTVATSIPITIFEN
jgi:hypothetical protein